MGEQWILTAEQMRWVDHHTIAHDIPAGDLMERAGVQLARACQKHQPDGGRIVVVVGVGNNAGDGWVAARILRQSQVAVTVIPLLLTEKADSLVRQKITLAEQAGVKIRPALSSANLPLLQVWLSRAVLVVDAIFGTGLSRPVSGWLAEAMNAINQIGRTVLSVDISSGVDSNQGLVLGEAVHASITLPIAAYKWGHYLQQGRIHSGWVLKPADIGIRMPTMIQAMADMPGLTRQAQLIERAVIRAAFPERGNEAFKQSFGHVWILGGSVGYTGAPKLAAMGAQAVGAGLVSMACAPDIYTVLAASSLEVMVHPQEQALWKRADAVVVGSGWGKQQQGLLAEALNQEMPLVLDADALNMLAVSPDLCARLKQRKSVSVLTPHAGEAARLLSVTSKEVQQNRVASAVALVEEYQAWVILKGAQTLVVSPDKQAWVNPFGSPNLATAGTGDVLAGMIGGLLAGGMSAETVLPAAVGLHALAGERQDWYRAGELPDLIAAEVRRFKSCR